MQEFKQYHPRLFCAGLQFLRSCVVFTLGRDNDVTTAGGFIVPVPHPAEERKFPILEFQQDSCAWPEPQAALIGLYVPTSQSVLGGRECGRLVGRARASPSAHTISPALSWLQVPLHLRRSEGREVCRQQQGQWSLSARSYSKWPVLYLFVPALFPECS